MEYPMLIMNDPDISSSWFQGLDVTIAHELAHNWFYGMLGSDERAYPWLDEGFTQSMEDRYGDWKYPEGIFKRRKLLPWTSPAREYSQDENRFLSLVHARDDLPISTPADGYWGYGQYAAGMTAKVMTYGATLTELDVPDKDGKFADVVLGFDDLKGYLAGHPYFGATVGRVVADADVDSAAREEVGGRGVPQIAAGDLDPAVGEDLSNATHSDSADADEMNALNVFKIHSDRGLLILNFIRFSQFFRVNLQCF